MGNNKSKQNQLEEHLELYKPLTTPTQTTTDFRAIVLDLLTRIESLAAKDPQITSTSFSFCQNIHMIKFYEYKHYYMIRITSKDFITVRKSFFNPKIIITHKNIHNYITRCTNIR